MPNDGFPGRGARATPQPTDDYLATIVRASSDAMIGLAADGTIQSWNPAAERIFGYTPFEAVGRPITMLTPPGYDAEQQALMSRLCAGDMVSVETVRRAKDGRTVHVQLNAAPVLDAEGQLALIAATLTDITERKRTEAALAERARLLDLSNDAIIVRDAHDRIIYWNHGATELYGWTREEALGQDLHTLLRTEFEAPFEQLIIALQQHDRMEGEVAQVTKDGRRIAVSSRWALDRDAEGRPGAILTTYNDITARKRAEDALRASEAKYRALFESMDEGYAVVEALADERGAWHDFRFLEVNPAFVQQTAMPDPVGRRATELLGTPNPAWAQVYGRVAETGAPVRFEEREQTLGRIFDLYAFRLGEAGSRRVGVLFNNITARKRAEEQLHASEARLQQALSIATVGVIFFDVTGAITSANAAFLRMSGYAPEDVAQGQVRWDVMTPAEFLPATRTALDELQTTGESTPYEKQYIRKDGTRWWGLFAAKRLSATESVEFILDVTDRKQAEEAVRTREERLRLVLESVQDYAIFTVDPEGRVTSWNDGAHQLKGYTAEEILGQPMERFYPDEDVAAGKPARERETAVREGRSEDESWRVRKDGARFWGNEIMTPLYADDGTQLGFTKICRDLTARKQAEDAVAQALASAQAARAEAEAALKTRDQFLSIASHELRTPLTPLLGYTGMLRQRLAAAPDAAQRRLVETIERQATRLNSLIETLLDVSRLQRGPFTLEPRRLDLASLAAQVVDDFRLTLPGDGRHPLTPLLADAPVPVLGDVERLEQVLHNLLSNAVKYSPDGGPIRVRVARQDGEAALEVADAGIGIPPEAQARLFEPFYRAANVGTQISGFGLGLYIVQEIVQHHGGRIAVDGRAGPGTTFRVLLPLAGG